MELSDSKQHLLDNFGEYEGMFFQGLKKAKVALTPDMQQLIKNLSNDVKGVIASQEKLDSKEGRDELCRKMDDFDSYFDAISDGKALKPIFLEVCQKVSKELENLIKINEKMVETGMSYTGDVQTESQKDDIFNIKADKLENIDDLPQAALEDRRSISPEEEEEEK